MPTTRAMTRLVAVLLALTPLTPDPVTAQEHTILALSHADFTAYELDPSTGEILNRFTAENQPHEGVVSPDGRTIFVAIPQNPPYVTILDADTFEELGRIESDYFSRSEEERLLGDVQNLCLVTNVARD